MTSDLVPDYQPQDGSYQVGGGDGKYGQSYVGQALDMILTGYNGGLSGATRPTAAEGLGPLEAWLQQIPLPVLQMFRPYTFGTADADWDDQYTAVQDILKSFKPKNREAWIAEFERLTGLNIDEGIVKFLESLIAAFKAARLDWVSQFEDKTGLNIDEGALKFFQSLIAKLKELHLDWVTDFELRTGLNIDEGIQKFLESLVAKLKANRLDWITEVETKTGLNIDEGPVAFLASLLELLGFNDLADRISVVDEILQDLIDGIRSIFKPGAVNTPVRDAIEAIISIKDAADRANMGIASIRAEQVGGKADEFLYPSANVLPSAAWQMFRHGPVGGTNNSLTWGPDGRGALVYKPVGIAGLGQADITYRWLNFSDPGATGTVMIQLSKAPASVASLTGLAVGSAFICWNMNATNQACDRFEITQDHARLQKVDASGNATNVGASVAIPAVHAGDQFSVVWNDTTNHVQLLRTPVGSSGAPTVVVDTTYTPSVGDFVGLGGHCPTFTGTATINNPCPNFAGITAHA